MAKPNNENTVHFKSVEPFFTKEKEGIKPNTVQEIDMSDERFRKLAAWSLCTMDNQFYIEIMDVTPVKYLKEKFTRPIKDISFYKNLCIISWDYKAI